MQLWRISAFADLSGEGGLHFAARWNSAGLPIVYLAASAAGALLEILVHLELARKELPDTYQLLEVEVPPDVKASPITGTGLPTDWETNLAVTRAIGDAWLRARTAALAIVPSAILPDTWNYLLNPVHPDAGRLAIRNVTSTKYDARLFRAAAG